ncbi:neutral zinc metallopeptidase [Pseudomonas sp. TH08]|uniref:KPN_02809 family neutral zinc metallopeptidase n=1 Tax=unclassified Pseudomonas TaxID=196821 RepID=UPI0019134222|nr:MULTISPECIES: neutral zinc metallopeptidase [unclassified Pseudomonas]MBK5527448.1 neutral zinc metallopeptidase [Pseudomonas sp. TH06]MBK5531299.1 neutral zinc metallopeptidase [Pseudomonas sp. TH08]
MLWNKSERSNNVDDQRKQKERRSATGIALATGLIASLAVAYGGYWAALETTVGPAAAAVVKAQHDAEIAALLKDDPHRVFIEAVLGSTEEVWTEFFAESGQAYSPPTLVLYNEKKPSACGVVDAQKHGAVYCPTDQQIYIDLRWLDEQTTTPSTVNDFAQAYIIAHEVGHHVQNFLGSHKKINEAKARGETVVGESGLDVRLELQADCLAGVWAFNAQQRLNWLEPDDIEEALDAAFDGGDDLLLDEDVDPNSFTHGTAEQRVSWFNTGFAQGQVGQCDTFAAKNL